MSGGDVCKLVGTLITEPVVTKQPLGDPILNTPIRNQDCCFELVVLADQVGTDNNTNDQTSEFFQQGPIVTDSALYLEKYVGGIWVEQFELVDNSYGTFYDFGFWSITDEFNSIGYVINWHTILTDGGLGAGSYRIRCDYTTITAETVEEYGCQYCLKEYSGVRADKTIRFEYYLNGLQGDKTNRTGQLNYGQDIQGNQKGWFNQLRVPGFFGFETREFEIETRQFKNKSKQQLTNTANVSFNAFLDEKRLPMYVHKKLMEMMQSSYLFVTDYNEGVNPDSFIDVPILPTGSYEPNYSRFSKLSGVELTFEQKYNQFQWKPC